MGAFSSNCKHILYGLYNFIKRYAELILETTHVITYHVIESLVHILLDQTVVSTLLTNEILIVYWTLETWQTKSDYHELLSAMFNEILLVHTKKSIYMFIFRQQDTFSIYLILLS